MEFVPGQWQRESVLAPLRVGILTLVAETELTIYTYMGLPQSAHSPLIKIFYRG